VCEDMGESCDLVTATANGRPYSPTAKPRRTPAVVRVCIPAMLLSVSVDVPAGFIVASVPVAIRPAVITHSPAVDNQADDHRGAS